MDTKLKRTIIRYMPTGGMALVVAVLVVLSGGCSAAHKGFGLQTGDLLFQVGSNSEMGNAIATVTSGERDVHYTHVGIALVNEGSVAVLEATTPSVRITPLDSFLRRSAMVENRPLVAVGRLHEEYRPLIAAAVERAKGQVGKLYDSLFLPDNDTYYCSELVQLFYLDDEGNPIFKPIAMNFRDAEGNLPAYWVEHYERYRMPIPENYAGSNPGDLSKSDKIEIVYRYF